MECGKQTLNRICKTVLFKPPPEEYYEIMEFKISIANEKKYRHIVVQGLASLKILHV